LLCVNKGIKFNGVEDALDTFILKLTFLEGSCKTGRKKYDIIVCTILIKFKLLLGNILEITSDRFSIFLKFIYKNRSRSDGTWEDN